MLESGVDILEGDSAHSLGEHVSVIIGGVDLHTVREWLQVHFLQDNDLGLSDQGADLADGIILGDFNLSLNNLGGDGQSMEETDLRWIHTGGSGWQDEVDVGDGSGLGSGSNSVGLNNGFQFGNWLVGENEGDLLFNVGQDGVQLGPGLTAVFSEPVVLLALGELIGP